MTHSIGFTGTRFGMSAQQKGTVYHLIHEITPVEAHHGDCRGADHDFHNLLRLHTPDITIIGHPPVNDRLRAFCSCDRSFPPADYKARDMSIVECCELLIAAPFGYEERRHSGTWMTVRMARAALKPITIVLPDGSIREENHG